MSWDGSPNGLAEHFFESKLKLLKEVSTLIEQRDALVKDLARSEEKWEKLKAAADQIIGGLERPHDAAVVAEGLRAIKQALAEDEK